MSRFSQGARQVLPTPTWTVIKHCKEVFAGSFGQHKCWTCAGSICKANFPEVVIF